MDGGVPEPETRKIDSDGAAGHLTVDLPALGRNFEKLSALLAPARAAAVVKADAYGLGAERVSRFLYGKGCRHFFVAHFVEATRLRPRLEPDATIFVLNGLQPGDERGCAASGIVPVLNSLEQWRRWSDMARAAKKTLPAVLQFDTGMSRLGLSPAENKTLAVAIKEDSGIKVLFLMSHLACADETDSEQNDDQLAEMLRITEVFPGIDICFANSGAIFLGTPYHGALARPGIALYGGAPTSGAVNPLEPVVSLDVAVVQTRTVPAGTKVGYGGTHVTAGETSLATISAGYADGLPRSLSGRGAVYCDGIRLPMVGRVSMDSITIDITALPEGRLRLGNLVEVLGRHQTIDDLARDAGTISYEILTGLGDRFRRHYREAEGGSIQGAK